MVRYRGVDAVVVRAAAYGERPDPSPWPDLTGRTAEHVRQWRAWLRRMWQDDSLVEAIEAASPSLAAAVEDVCRGQLAKPRRVLRVVESVINYVLRMTTRPTPFGLFAGVAPVAVGPRASVRWGGKHQVRVRPDAWWLTELATRLEAQPALLRALPVAANTMSFVRGDRLVLPSQPYRNDAGDVSPADVAVRHSRPVQTVMRAAQSPILVGDLIAKVTTEFPDAPTGAIEAMIVNLVAVGALITSLRPPMDVTDPLAHLLERPDEIPDDPLQATVSELREIGEMLARYSTTQSRRDHRILRRKVSARMAGLCDRPDPPVAIDTRMDCHIELPPAVIREAEATASVLVRLTPQPFGNPAWRAWHDDFMNRYGPGAVVPVTEIVNPDRGLGYPADYRGSPRRLPAPTLSARDHTLLRLAQAAALNGSGELLLDEHTLAELASETAARRPRPTPHSELRFTLHATSTNDLDAGDFTLVVTGATRQAGTSIGRFLYLFDDSDRDQFSEALRGLPTLNAGAVTAQVSCPPLSPRSQNLARVPGVFPLISLAEHRPEIDTPIRLDDLAVTGDENRLLLVCLSTGRIVEPIMLNALEFRHATHPLARFLCEITTARAAACIPFTWGAAAKLPYLPRVRYRRSVLRPACWNIRASDLPDRRASWSEWEQAWTALQRTHRIPWRVYLGEHDVLVRLDLAEPAHRVMLRTHLARADTADLIEAPDEDASAWINHRPHEIALPLACADPPADPPPILRTTGPLRTIRHRGYAPGASSWLYARLHGHADGQTELITAHLPELLADLADGLANDWPGRRPDAWFLRYHDPDPHLRVRVRLDSADAYGAAAQILGRWADRLRTAGLIRSAVLDTHHPEVGRYGTGPALEAAEAVFVADSAATIAQLVVTASPAGPHPQAITATSLLELAGAFTGSPAQGLRWLIDHAPNSGPAPTRRTREQALQLADPGTGYSGVRALTGGEHLEEAWRRRREAVRAYRGHLTGVDGPDPDRVLASLLHMHHARMIGIDPDSERVCLRLARAVALSRIARTAPIAGVRP